MSFKIGDRVVITDPLGIPKNLGKLATVESLAILGTDFYLVYVDNLGYFTVRIREATEMDKVLEGL